MARLLTALALTVLVGAGHGLLACGEKYFAVGRGTRYDRPAVVRAPARILLHASPGSQLATLLMRLSLEEGLTKVGYSPVTVADLDALERRLQKGSWDLVIVDFDDREALRLAASADSAVVAVAFGARRVLQTQARPVRPVAAPRRFSTMLAAVDDVLEELAARRGAARRKAGRE